MVFAVIAAILAGVLLQPFDIGDTTTGLVAGLVMSVAILVFALAIRARLPRYEQRLMVGARCDWWTTVGIALGLAIAARIVTGIIAALATEIDPSLCRKYAEAADLSMPAMWQRIALAFALVVLAPLGEELLFRGVLLRGFVRLMPFRPAALVSGVLFGLAHLQYWTTWPLLIGVSLFGVAAAFAYRSFGYRTSVLAHALFNAIAAIFLFVDVGQNDPNSCSS